MSRTLKLTLILLSLVKLWLTLAFPLTVNAFAGHDDRLFLNLAASFINWLDALNNPFIHNAWLGDYNNLTLAKGPIFPLFIATNFTLNLPLMFSYTLLYIIAGLFLIYALKNLIPHPFVLLVLYSVYLFNPAILPTISREGLYSPLTIMVIAGLIGMYTHRNVELTKLSVWAIFSGLALAAFWMTREESIWLIPLVILLLSYTVFDCYRTLHFSQRFFQISCLCVLPLILLLSGIHLISALNQSYYGVYTVVEFKAPHFLSGYGALLRVKHLDRKRRVPVPREVRQKIYAVSPAFKELENSLEGDLGKHWSVPGCQLYPKRCGEIVGGWFMWALRDAVAAAGYYTSGDKAEAYYARLANEINTACDKQLLDCQAERATIMTPFVLSEDTTPLLDAFVQGISSIINFDLNWIDAPSYSIGSEELLLLFYDLTRNRLAPTLQTTQRLEVTGWALNSRGKPITFRIKSRTNNQEQKILPESRTREDVYHYFANQYAHAKNSGFSFTSLCVKDCELHLYQDNTLAAVIDLDNPQQDQKRFTDIYFHIDAVTFQQSPFYHRLSMQNQLDSFKRNKLQAIANGYSKIVPSLAYAAFIMYIITLGISIFSRQLTFFLVLNTALLSIVGLRLLMLAYLDITVFPAVSNLAYLVPFYPLLLIFIVLAFIDFAQQNIVINQIQQWLSFGFRKLSFLKK